MNNRGTYFYYFHTCVRSHNWLMYTSKKYQFILWLLQDSNHKNDQLLRTNILLIFNSKKKGLRDRKILFPVFFEIYSRFLGQIEDVTMIRRKYYSFDLVQQKSNSRIKINSKSKHSITLKKQFLKAFFLFLSNFSIVLLTQHTSSSKEI